MNNSEVGTIFALPWVITWFGHVLPNYEDVVRLYDFFLAKPPLMPIYFATVLVLHRESEIYMGECDLATVHGLLSRIPADLPFENLLLQANSLYKRHPPDIYLEERVTDRMKWLEAQMRPRRIRPPEPEPKPSGIGGPVMVSAALVVPVVIGYAAYKWLNSS